MSNKFKIEEKEIDISFDDLLNDEILISSLPYNYKVKFIDSSALKNVVKNIETTNGRNHFIFIDQKVADLYASRLFDSQRLFKMVAIEENKELPAVTDLLDKLQENNFSKKETFLSIGGGIIQDISAFARAVFKRGINWTYIPTTLLAMGDSCIGSKSCLNYGSIKNQLGLFSAPREVFICTDMLKTLDKRDVLSGYGEILKLSIVGGKECLSKFSQIVTEQKGDVLANIDQLIKLALKIKKAVIELDEFEYDIRKALNYGHTVGHAVEPLVNYEIPHGIAVSIGMMIENLISAEFGTLPISEAEQMNELIMKFVDKKSISYLKNIAVEHLVENMKKDKKSSNSDIFMAVPFKLGSFGIIKIASNQALSEFLSAALKKIQNN